MWKSQNKWMRTHGHGHGRRGTERDVRVLATNWFGGTWQWQRRRWRRRLLCLNTTTWAIIKTSQVKWSCKNLSRNRNRSRCNHKFYASSWDSFFKKALAHYFGFHDWFCGLMLVHWLVSAKAHVGSCRGWVCTRSLVILVYRREITKNLDPLCSTPLYNGKLSPPALLLFSLYFGAGRVLHQLLQRRPNAVTIFIRFLLLCIAFFFFFCLLTFLLWPKVVGIKIDRL